MGEGMKGSCQVGRRERFVEPCLLFLLAQQKDHGYTLLQRLERYGFDESSPDPGSLYRILRKMEQDGHIRSSWESGDFGPAKRVYEITEQGRETLQGWIKLLERNLSYINLLIVDCKKEQL